MRWQKVQKQHHKRNRIYKKDHRILDTEYEQSITNLTNSREQHRRCNRHYKKAITEVTDSTKRQSIIVIDDLIIRIHYQTRSIHLNNKLSLILIDNLTNYLRSHKLGKDHK